MAGKNCNGVATDQPYLSNTRAYCEGRGVAAAAGGTNGFTTGTTGAADGLITWTAKIPGNQYTVRLIDPGGLSVPLLVLPGIGAINVRLETDIGGDIVSTGAEVVAAVEANPVTDAEVGVVAGGTGLGVQAAETVILTGTTDNPHHPGPDADAWGRGFDSWIADPAGGPPGAQDCCTLKYGGGYTP